MLLKESPVYIKDVKAHYGRSCYFYQMAEASTKWRPPHSRPSTVNTVIKNI